MATPLRRVISCARSLRNAVSISSSVGPSSPPGALVFIRSTTLRRISPNPLDQGCPPGVRCSRRAALPRLPARSTSSCSEILGRAIRAAHLGFGGDVPLRASQLRGLRWSDVDFVGRQINVAQTFVRLCHMRRRPTRTAANRTQWTTTASGRDAIPRMHRIDRLLTLGRLRLAALFLASPE